MSRHDRRSYHWIESQLARIKSLEQQLSNAFVIGEERPVAKLRALVDELKLRLDVLDSVLEFERGQFAAARAAFR